MWYVICVEDPDRFEKVTGERWSVGACYSSGTVIASADVLKERGLVACEIGSDAPDWGSQCWNPEKRCLVDIQLTKADLAPRIAELVTQLAEARAMEADLPE